MTLMIVLLLILALVGCARVPVVPSPEDLVHPGPDEPVRLSTPEDWARWMNETMRQLDKAHPLPIVR